MLEDKDQSHIHLGKFVGEKQTGIYGTNQPLIEVLLRILPAENKTIQVNNHIDIYHLLLATLGRNQPPMISPPRHHTC
jgi:hypothetical protein